MRCWLSESGLSGSSSELEEPPLLNWESKMTSERLRVTRRRTAKWCFLVSKNHLCFAVALSARNSFVMLRMATGRVRGAAKAAIFLSRLPRRIQRRDVIQSHSCYRRKFAFTLSSTSSLTMALAEEDFVGHDRDLTRRYFELRNTSEKRFVVPPPPLSYCARLLPLFSFLLLLLLQLIT